jgi:hypothetical protein
MQGSPLPEPELPALPVAASLDTESFTFLITMSRPCVGPTAAGQFFFNNPAIPVRYNAHTVTVNGDKLYGIANPGGGDPSAPGSFFGAQEGTLRDDNGVLVPPWFGFPCTFT